MKKGGGCVGDSGGEMGFDGEMKSARDGHKEKYLYENSIFL